MILATFAIACVAAWGLSGIRHTRAYLSIEMNSAAPPGLTAADRLAKWFYINRNVLRRNERKYHVDRRAIAGLIAYESLGNVRSSFYGGLVRFVGPGKIHYKDDRIDEGLPLAKEIEDLGYLPRQTESQRKSLVSTAAGAITYAAAIMRGFSDRAADAGYNVRCDPGMLVTFASGWHISEMHALFVRKRAPTPLLPNWPGRWVRGQMAYIQKAVGLPAPGVCGRPRTILGRSKPDV